MMGQKLPDFPTARWADAMAPSLDNIAQLAREALRDLPKPFADLAASVAIRVADFPDGDVLTDLEADSAYELLGLFVGEGLSEGGAAPQSGQLNNEIWLYRRPILDY